MLAAAPQPRPNEEKKPSKIPSGDACGPCVSSNFLQKQQRNAEDKNLRFFEKLPVRDAGSAYARVEPKLWCKSD